MKSYLPLFLCLLLLFGRSASAEDGAVDLGCKMNMKILRLRCYSTKQMAQTESEMAQGRKKYWAGAF